MSIDELQTELSHHDYQMELDPQTLDVMVLKNPNHKMAKISGRIRYQVQVFGKPSATVLQTCILHYANTPLDERFKNAQLHVKLSKTDLNALRKLPIGKITNKFHWQLTTAQVTALNHLLAQFDLTQLESLDKDSLI